MKWPETDYYDVKTGKRYPADTKKCDRDLRGAVGRKGLTPHIVSLVRNFLDGKDIYSACGTQFFRLRG